MRKFLSLPVFIAAFTFANGDSVADEGSALVVFPAIENGDINGDWSMDLSDAIGLLLYLYVGGPAPVPMACGDEEPSIKNGDANGDGELDVSDGIYLMRWLFLGGPDPAPAQCGLLQGFGAAATQRPISDFLSVQGTFCIAPPAGGSCEDLGASLDPASGCCLFVPPTPNFFGWFDPASLNFASFDYAGLAAANILALSGGTIDLGTTMSGSVTERPLPDGRAEVHVRLLTRRALAWAFNFNETDCPPGNPFATCALRFGYRPVEVLAGATPALGDLLHHMVIINTAPGAPLPDLVQVGFAPAPGQEFQTHSFYSRASGALRAPFGVSEGTPGRLENTQTGLVGLVGTPQAPSFDGFPAEHIKIYAVGQ